MTLALAGVSFVINVLAILVASAAVAAVKRGKRQVRAAQLELVAALQTAADAEAAKETALRLLEEQRLLRLEDLGTFRAQVLALQLSYDETLSQYRAALAIEKPLVSRRLQ